MTEYRNMVETYNDHIDQHSRDGESRNLLARLKAFEAAETDAAYEAEETVYDALAGTLDEAACRALLAELSASAPAQALWTGRVIKLRMTKQQTLGRVNMGRDGMPSSITLRAPLAHPMVVAHELAHVLLDLAHGPRPEWPTGPPQPFPHEYADREDYLSALTAYLGPTASEPGSQGHLYPKPFSSHGPEWKNLYVALVEAVLALGYAESLAEAFATSSSAVAA